MSEWIKCSEQMPLEDGRYMVIESYANNHTWVGVCSLRKGKWDSSAVKYWQELPSIDELDKK